MTETDESDGRRTDDGGEREEPPEWAKERARELAAATDADDADGEGDENGTDDEPERAPDVPVDVVDEAERLTRLAREAEAADGAETEAAAELYRERRDELVNGHGYEPRIRDEDDTLVLYPAEWVDDDTVRFDRIENTDRAVEVSLSGAGDTDRYRAVADYNEAVADAVAEAHGEVHGDNARRFAEFMSNHYVREVDDATPDMRAEFREEYFPRNAWPTDEQQAELERSLELVRQVAADVTDPA
ncbi:hypothetical protein JCM17823_14460 [Halorubrum gandharaense]